MRARARARDVLRMCEGVIVGVGVGMCICVVVACIEAGCPPSWPPAVRRTALLQFSCRFAVWPRLVVCLFVCLQLVDDKTAADYNLEGGATVHLVCCNIATLHVEMLHAALVSMLQRLNRACCMLHAAAIWCSSMFAARCMLQQLYFPCCCVRLRLRGVSGRSCDVSMCLRQRKCRVVHAPA